LVPDKYTKTVSGFAENIIFGNITVWKRKLFFSIDSEKKPKQ
jgi:hypothetical protein